MDGPAGPGCLQPEREDGRGGWIGPPTLDLVDNVIAGILALVIGLLVAVAGYRALRAMIALLGAVLGLGIGAAAAGGLPPEGTSHTIVTWVVAIVAALLCGWLAYAFYRVAVLLGLAAIGFSIGAGATVALGVRGDWVAWLAGAALAVVLVVIGLVADLPAVLLIVLTGLAGANLAVTGVMLLTGVAHLAGTAAGQPAAAGWWWGVAALVLALVAIGVQLRSLGRSRAPMRAQWGARATR